MKSIFVLIPFLLQGGVIKGPFRVADAEPGHHQVNLQAAMAADGHFAVAWLDSLWRSGYLDHYDLYIRFFDKNGNPMTDPYKVKKVNDSTTIIRGPALAMDTLGNTILMWEDKRQEPPDFPINDRFQCFVPDGTPADTAKTLPSVPWINFFAGKYMGLSNRGEFVVVTSVASGSVPLGTGIWVQRFNLDGEPLDTAFLAHEDLGDTWPLPDTEITQYPSAAFNDEGDLLVTWIRGQLTAHMQPRYQVFDSLDKPISWEPLGHRLDYGDSLAGACIPDPCWIDNDGFVAFWTDYCIPPYLPIPLVGRVFSQKGAVKHPIRALVRDSLWLNVQDPRGRFSTAVLPDGRFATTHTRSYSDFSTGEERHWEHAGGIIGKVVNNEPLRYTNLFEYSAPWGTDTVNSFWSSYFHFQTPAVAASSDRLVWVYSRLNTDTIFEAWAVITDWDMGEDIVENPQITQPTDWQVANPIGREIVLRYSDHPQGFHASVYDVSGRRVDELKSPNQNGILIWGPHQNPGVYFIVSDGSKGNPLKVVLVR